MVPLAKPAGDHQGAHVGWWREAAHGDRPRVVSLGVLPRPQWDHGGVVSGHPRPPRGP